MLAVVDVVLMTTARVSVMAPLPVNRKTPLLLPPVVLLLMVMMLRLLCPPRSPWLFTSTVPPLMFKPPVQLLLALVSRRLPSPVLVSPWAASLPPMVPSTEKVMPLGTSMMFPADEANNHCRATFELPEAVARNEPPLRTTLVPPRALSLLVWNTPALRVRSPERLGLLPFIVTVP